MYRGPRKYRRLVPIMGSRKKWGGGGEKAEPKMSGPESQILHSNEKHI